MAIKRGEGMIWFEKMGHHANFVAGLGMLCAVLWYISDALATFVPDAVAGMLLAGIFKGVFGFSALLLLGNTLIIAWKMTQKLWK
ncbi:MAG: hypothetical protein QW751_03120 [Candidatus Aenigmatarchaeota archaeon]